MRNRCGLALRAKCWGEKNNRGAKFVILGMKNLWGRKKLLFPERLRWFTQGTTLQVTSDPVLINHSELKPRSSVRTRTSEIVGKTCLCDVFVKNEILTHRCFVKYKRETRLHQIFHDICKRSAGLQVFLTDELFSNRDWWCRWLLIGGVLDSCIEMPLTLDRNCLCILIGNAFDFWLDVHMAMWKGAVLRKGVPTRCRFGLFQSSFKFTSHNKDPVTTHKDNLTQSSAVFTTKDRTCLESKHSSTENLHWTI